MFGPVFICSMYLPREPYLTEIKMGPRVTSTRVMSFGPLVCTALSASTFNNITLVLFDMLTSFFGNIVLFYISDPGKRWLSSTSLDKSMDIREDPQSSI